PVRHQFTYSLFYLSVPLDRLDVTSVKYRFKSKPWWETWRLVTFNQWGLFSLWSEDCLVGRPFIPIQSSWSVTQNVRRRLRHRGYCTRGLIQIVYVTTPRVMGYGFNPLSMYYCYESYPGRIIRTFSHPCSELNGMTLRYLVLEVRNTFGEGDMYVLDYQQASGKQIPVVTHNIPRRFHVSPFNNRLGYYRFVTLRKPRQKLWIRVSIYDTLPNYPERSTSSTNQTESSPKFWASINGMGYRLDGWSLGQLMLAYPLTVFFTIPRILWQAVQLAYRYRLPIFVKPDPLDDTLVIQPPDGFEYYTAVLFLGLLQTLVDRAEVNYVFRVWLPGMTGSPVELTKEGVEKGERKVIRMGFRNYSVCTRLFAGENDTWVVLLVGFVERHWWCDKREELLVELANYANELTEGYHVDGDGQLVVTNFNRWLGALDQYLWSKILATSPHKSSLWLVTHDELYCVLQTQWRSLVKDNPRGHLIHLHFISIGSRTDATSGIFWHQDQNELATLLGLYDHVYWLMFLSSDTVRDSLLRWSSLGTTNVHPILVCPYQGSHLPRRFVDTCTQTMLVKSEQLYRRALTSLFSREVLQGLPGIWWGSPEGKEITPNLRHRYHRRRIWKYYATYILDYGLYRLTMNPAPDTPAYCCWTRILGEWPRLLEISVGLGNSRPISATANNHCELLQRESPSNSITRWSLLTEYCATLPLSGRNFVQVKEQ
ncbi:hypothetical protein IWQ61_007690, partial [Dispira simplex]